jgi:hypothetical protein
VTIDPVAFLASARRDLARLPALLDALLSDVDDCAVAHAPGAGRVSPVEIVCHLRDEETEDFGARVRVVVEGRRRLRADRPRALGRRARLTRRTIRAPRSPH